MDLNVRITKMTGTGKVKAYADLYIDDSIVIHGLKVVETEKGRTVFMPSNSWKDQNGNYKNSDIAHPVSAEARATITDAVLAAYDAELGIENSNAMNGLC